MYAIQIYNGSSATTIHEPGTSDAKVGDAKVSREVNAFDSLTFTAYPDNPGYGELAEFATTVRALDTKRGVVVFEGRVIQALPSMGSDGLVSKSVTCEGLMGYLCDSSLDWEDTQHYADASGKTGLVAYVEKLLGLHNAKVEEHKRIHPGTITLQTFETSGGVTKGVDRASTWENLKSKLIDVFGGEMRVRRGSDGLLYLDYAESLGTTRATAIELARNMSSASRTVDPSGVITRLYPYGCKQVEETTDDTGAAVEQETEKRLTIESVNDGVAYIDDEVAMARYGIIEGHHEWDDVTTATALMGKAQSWLGQNNGLPTSHSISALDLSLLGLDYDGFEIFDSYPCRNPLIGLDDTLEVVRQTLDLSSPESSTLEFGQTTQRLSAEIGRVPSMGDIQQVESQTKTEIFNSESRTESSVSSVRVEASQIASTVSAEVEEVREVAYEVQGQVGTVYEITQTNSQQITELLQTAEGWDFTFSELEQTVTQIGDSVSTEYSERLKYIRFVDGEIWLGRDPDPGQDDFKVVISNERIRFLQNNVEVAYISNQQLFITDARVTTRLEIGDFAFFPRENGNLTLRYIGG